MRHEYPRVPMFEHGDLRYPRGRDDVTGEAMGQPRCVDTLH